MNIVPPFFIRGSASLLNPLKHLLRLSLEIDIERHEDGRLKLLGERFDIWLGALVKIGDRDLGAQGSKSARTSPADRVFVGNADDQRLLAFEGDLSSGKTGMFMPAQSPTLYSKYLTAKAARGSLLDCSSRMERHLWRLALPPRIRRVDADRGLQQWIAIDRKKRALG